MWPLFEDRFGRVLRQFDMVLDGVSNGDAFTWSEQIRYSDGEIHDRVWDITKIGDGRYEGRTESLVGVARGESVDANSFRWRYTLKLGGLSLRFDDWLYAQNENVFINRARATKFGLMVASTTVLLTREPMVAARAA